MVFRFYFKGTGAVPLIFPPSPGITENIEDIFLKYGENFHTMEKR